MEVQRLIQWLYPDKCIVCGVLLERSHPDMPQYTCVACERTIDEVKKCPKCGKPYVVQDKCLTCHEMSSRITSVKGLFPYEGNYKESILRWKYRGIRKYSKGFAGLIVSSVLNKENLGIDALIPIPIAPNRYRERGFNQALDLAQEISNLTGIPVVDCLERTQATKPQSACSKEERHRNIAGTIRVCQTLPRQPFRRVAFVDDIYTTGSTVLECIRVLEKTCYLPQEIYVLTVGIAI